jgi:hypothetical protein
MKTLRCVGFILCALIFPMSTAVADISGTYVGRGSNIAVFVQIVDTGGGHLVGRYEQVVLQADGKMEDVNATVAGAVNGETVVLALKTSDFFAATIPVSGTFRGRVLHLTGGGGLVLNLVAGDESDFRAEVAGLTEQGREAIAARAQEAAEKQAKLEADRLALLQNLTGRMSEFITRANARAPKFAPVEQQYRVITERMRGGLNRERSIYGGGQAAVARSQLSVALNQAAIEANQLHINVQGSYRDFDFTSEQLGREAAKADQWCTEAVPEALLTACSRFVDTRQKFAQRVSATRAAFAHLEDVWNVEHREQEAIVQASQFAAQ